MTKLRNDLAQKEEECADMKDLLQEAGDEFLAKQEEVDKIHNNVKELENQVRTHIHYTYILEVQGATHPSF